MYRWQIQIALAAPDLVDIGELWSYILLMLVPMYYIATS